MKYFSFSKQLTRVAIISITTLGFISNAFAISVNFRTDDNGVRKGMSDWGIGWLGNTTNKVNHMGGAQNVSHVRIGCPKEWALGPNDSLVVDAVAEVDKQMESAMIVINANRNARVGIVCSGGNSINSWYVQRDGENIRGDRWLRMFKAVVNHIVSRYNVSVSFIEVANEQDFGGKKGRPENIANIMEKFQNDPQLGNIIQIGPSTLSANAAQNWYPAARNVTDWGATHVINGSKQNYINFIQTVIRDGKQYWGSEIHHLAEVIIAENYGGRGGNWWPYSLGAVEGLFCQLSQQGNRIFYQEASRKFAVTSAYRSADNQSIHIFAATANNGDDTFTFTATDRSDLYFNGQGPQSSYTVSLSGSEAVHIEVTWGNSGNNNGGNNGGNNNGGNNNGGNNNGGNNNGGNNGGNNNGGNNGGNNNGGNNGGNNNGGGNFVFGLEADGTLYHTQGPQSASWHFLCINGDCRPGNLVNGRFERETGITSGSHFIEFKVQDNATGQCIASASDVSPGSGLSNSSCN